MIAATQNELERAIRENLPPPKDPQARERYESELRDWLSRSEVDRAVAGFGHCAVAWDSSLTF